MSKKILSFAEGAARLDLALSQCQRSGSIADLALLVGEMARGQIALLRFLDRNFPDDANIRAAVFGQAEQHQHAGKIVHKGPEK